MSRMQGADGQQEGCAMNSSKREQYQQYLKSDIWKKIRQQVIKRDRTCTKCGEKKHLVVHHFGYPLVLGEETMDMLTTLCESCHNILHGGLPRSMPRADRVKAKKLKKKRKFASYCKIYSPAEIAAYQAAL